MSGKVEPHMDKDALDLLTELVKADTTNIEDPSHGRMEKRHYKEGAQIIAKRAKEWGLESFVWDAREQLPGGHTVFKEPRPNVVIDIPGTFVERLLIAPHFDVVPVPDEQLKRWKSPPHELVLRDDGRYYGRGAADDLGSGIVSGLLAMRRLAEHGKLKIGMRMIACNDEETGGAGGIEALRDYDAALPEGSPKRLLSARMTVIPDGSPHVAAGSSGVSFVDVSMSPGTTVGEYLRVSESVAKFKDVAKSWESQLPSPPEPVGKSPHPHITGRATITLSDLRSPSGKDGLSSLHSNSDAANQIPASVSLRFSGRKEELQELSEHFSKGIRGPFKSQSTLDKNTLSVEVIGKSGHGGYPHRALNPVPEATRALLSAIEAGLLEDSPVEAGSLTLDMRSPPEMESSEAISIFMNYFQRLRDEVEGAKAMVPPGRDRSGYFISANDPRVVEIERIYSEVCGRSVGIYGEYGGTDASTLRHLKTPAGDPMPVVVVGAMDDDAHIHDAEESIHPRCFNEVVELLVRWAEAAK